MDAKTSKLMFNLRNNKTLHCLKVSPHKMILNCKEKNSNFIVGKRPGHQHFNQVSEVNVTGEEVT